MKILLGQDELGFANCVAFVRGTISSRSIVVYICTYHHKTTTISRLKERSVLFFLWMMWPPPPSPPAHALTPLLLVTTRGIHYQPTTRVTKAVFSAEELNVLKIFFTLRNILRIQDRWCFSAFNLSFI